MNTTTLILILALTLPYLILFLLVGLALMIALAPRLYTRRLRHKLAGFVIWQWIRGNRLSIWVHKWLWNEGNGHQPKDMVDFID